MRLALEEGKKSLVNDDVPVGAVIVKDNQVIGVGYNTKEKDQSVIGHAEINAITSASNMLGRYRLDNCVIYITKEPCLMCMGAILSARISKIVYGAHDLRFGTSELATKNNFNHTCDIKGGVLAKDCEDLLSGFFKKLRGKNESIRKITNRERKEKTATKNTSVNS